MMDIDAPTPSAAFSPETPVYPLTMDFFHNDARA